MWNAQYRRQGSALVYNTGRPFDSAMRLITQGTIEQPDALVCSEGTEARPHPPTQFAIVDSQSWDRARTRARARRPSRCRAPLSARGWGWGAGVLVRRARAAGAGP